MPDNIQTVLNALGGRQKPYKDGFLVCCPAHDDKNPSLIISQKGEKIITHCFAGCTQREIAEALRTRGVDIKEHHDWIYHPDDEVFRHVPMPGEKPTEHYCYRDANKNVLGVVYRYDEEDGTKSFCVATPWRDESGHVEYQLKGFPKPHPLYGLDDLAQKPLAPVLVVEGEKAADAAYAMECFKDYVCMTWPGGVNGFDKADLSPLKGRNVVCWPDNDTPGKKAMEKFADLAAATGARSVSIVSPPDFLPGKWDLADEIPPELNVIELIAGAEVVRRSLIDLILSAATLKDIDLPEREIVIMPFIKLSSLTMMFAARGIGKTWVALHMAHSIATGEPFFRYDVPKARSVLLIDGEMPLSDIKNRLKALGAEETENLYILSSELMYLHDRPLNIQNPDDQQRLMDALYELKQTGINIEVLIFDNLSSLSSGVDENDNTELEGFLQWLIQLRHTGYAVMFVHHAGKKGDQRGASRREDLLDTVIKLERNKEEGFVHAGAWFDLTFDKTRGETPQPDALRAILTQSPDGLVTFAFKDGKTATKPMQMLKLIYDEMPDKLKDIAEKMKITSGGASQHKKKLEDMGFLHHTDKGFEVTEKGLEALAQVWPQYRNDIGLSKEERQRKRDAEKLPF